MKWNQEQVEQMVLNFLQQQHPEFGIQSATLEVEYENENVQSWWVSCEHKNGDESIMEDEQVVLLIGQQQGWKQLTDVSARDLDEGGFVLSVNGR